MPSNLSNDNRFSCIWSSFNCNAAISHFITIGFRSLFTFRILPFSVFDLCIYLAFINVLPLQIIAKQFSGSQIDSWIHYSLQQINCTRVLREFGEVECWMRTKQNMSVPKTKLNGKVHQFIKTISFCVPNDSNQGLDIKYKLFIIFSSVRKILH